MSEPRQPREFSSDQILENYQHLNEIDWLRDEEEETEYPRNQSAVSENTVNVVNTGDYACQNDLQTNPDTIEAEGRDFTVKEPDGA